jgi:hypothetical protein
MHRPPATDTSISSSSQGGDEDWLFIGGTDHDWQDGNDATWYAPEEEWSWTTADGELMAFQDDSLASFNPRGAVAAEIEHGQLWTWAPADNEHLWADWSTATWSD